MEEEGTQQLVKSHRWYAPLTCVTPFSKYCALTLFVVLPFVGFFAGYTLRLDTESICTSDCSDASRVKTEVASSTFNYITASFEGDDSPLRVHFLTTYKYPELYPGSDLLTIYFGDGSNAEIATGVEHTYSAPGTYAVRLEGCNPNTDLFCDPIELDTLTITVGEPVASNVAHEDVRRPRGELLATTTVDMIAYRIRYTHDRVELLRGAEVVQTIPWDTSFRAWFNDDASLMVTNIDIDYDHYPDLALMVGAGSGSNRFYAFYRFNPDTYRLEQFVGFGLPECREGCPNPAITIANRSITFGSMTSNEWRYSEYRFDGERYQPYREWSESWR